MVESKFEVELIRLIVGNYPDEVRRELRRREIYWNDKLGQLGHCSVCGGNDGSFNIGRKNYFYCKKHRKCWCIGENIFSDWREENEEIWEKNFKKYSKYERIGGSEWLDNKVQLENLDIEKDLWVTGLQFLLYLQFTSFSLRGEL